MAPEARPRPLKKEKYMTLWEMVKELHEMLEAGEIEDSEEVDCLDDTFDVSRFIKDMFNNLSEDEESAVEQLSERQIATIYQIYEGYCNGDWRSLEEYL